MNEFNRSEITMNVVVMNFTDHLDELHDPRELKLCRKKSVDTLQGKAGNQEFRWCLHSTTETELRNQTVYN
jgi:hypothetical protein